MEMDSNNHSVFSLNYLLILTTFDCIGVIDNTVSSRLKEIFNKISLNYNIILNTWVNQEYYIKIVFKAQPNTELTKFINAYKSAGSRLIKKEYPMVEDKLVNQQFWSKSFFLLTMGDIDEKIIKAYLKKRGNGNNTYEV